MNEIELNAYLDAALALHGLDMDASRKLEVAKQLTLLQGMASLVVERPLPADIEPANVFRP